MRAAAGGGCSRLHAAYLLAVWRAHAHPPACPLPPPIPIVPGGELILTVFEKRLPDAIEKQPFRKLLEVSGASPAPARQPAAPTHTPAR